MFCKECGAKIPDDSEFCLNCGVTIHKIPKNDNVIIKFLKNYKITLISLVICIFAYISLFPFEIRLFLGLIGLPSLFIGFRNEIVKLDEKY